MKQVSKIEFDWLYENYLKYRKHKNWAITSKRKKAKRRKYYVSDKDYELAKKYLKSITIK